MFERVAKLVKTDRSRSWRLDQLARSIFLTEFVSAFFLAMRYFFKAKATLANSICYFGGGCDEAPRLNHSPSSSNSAPPFAGLFVCYLLPGWPRIFPNNP